VPADHTVIDLDFYSTEELKEALYHCLQLLYFSLNHFRFAWKSIIREHSLAEC
jgi:hypothetical protein